MADHDALSLDDEARIVLLLFGPLESGGEYWCYVAVKPSRHDEFKRAMDSKRYNIQNFVSDDFGEVIVSGEGGLPPRDITKQVAAMFNVPIRQLFSDIDPQAALAMALEDRKNANN
jgi:hypothetical protein